MLLLLLSSFVLLPGCCETNPSLNCQCNTAHLSYNDSLIDVYDSDTIARERHNTYYNLKPLENNGGWEAYRLTMNHSFSAYIQFYTLTRTRDGAILEVRQMYEDRTHDTLITDKQYNVVLTKTQWNTIKKEIISTCYWSNKIGKDRCQGCLDGGAWVLEGYDPFRKNCAKKEQHLDVCDFGSGGKLGKLCRTIRKYAKEEKLNVYQDE